MSDFRQYGMTKRELLERMKDINDNDVITFGNGLPNGKLLTFHRFKLRDDTDRNSLVYSLEFNE